MVCSRTFLLHQNIFPSSPPTWKSQNMPVMLDYCRAGSTPVEDCGLRDFAKLVGAKLRKTKETQGERRRGGLCYFVNFSMAKVSTMRNWMVFAVLMWNTENTRNG